MDLGTVIGLIAGIAVVLIANVMEGGRLDQLLNPSASLLVFGGTLAATLASAGLHNVLLVPGAIAYALRAPKLQPGALIEKLVSLAQQARREGLLSLEEERKNLDDPFFAKGLQFVIDGADPEMVEEVMENALQAEQRHYLVAAGVLETAGGYAPTMGIIGTVLGLIHVLGNLEDTSSLGPAIAVAFMATFYGIASANLLWLPLASKIKANVQAEAELRRMVVEGILSIQNGDNPMIVREKLEAFLAAGAGGKEGKGGTGTAAEGASGRSGTRGEAGARMAGVGD
ncbi:flagellar motor protein [Thermaerobacter subterraneus]|uniref:Flagellar motor component n=1 Tax=Thermaerobacter subterraneus DSM 13965 TaxID=867903 RepID=K6PML5_9FIRM|nr:flagellar motor protein [Thermaerobacter subterraneus]EKP94127.1 flagellar motor component [Thermaerobacter subterraneus DSM 13965]